MKTTSKRLYRGLALVGLVAVLAPSQGLAQRTPANLTSGRVEFTQPIPVPVCLTRVQAIARQQGWQNVIVNNNQTVMASQANLVLQVICTPHAAFIAGAGAGEQPGPLVDRIIAAVDAVFD